MFNLEHCVVARVSRFQIARMFLGPTQNTNIYGPRSFLVRDPERWQYQEGGGSMDCGA